MRILKNTVGHSYKVSIQEETYSQPAVQTESEKAIPVHRVPDQCKGHEMVRPVQAGRTGLVKLEEW